MLPAGLCYAAEGLMRSCGALTLRAEERSAEKLLLRNTQQAHTHKAGVESRLADEFFCLTSS